MMQLIEFIATALTLIGFYMIADGNIYGFAISIFANLLWIFWGMGKNAVSLMGLNLVLIFINLYGLKVI